MHRIFLGLVAPYNEQCPALCGTDVTIIGLSDSYTEDGWYLQVNDSNIVYMESGAITETVPCESGMADLAIVSGAVVGTPYVWHNGSWNPLITVELKTQNIGVDFTLITQTEDYFANELTGVCQISTDGGTTWTDVGTITNAELQIGTEVIFNTTETNYIYRVIVTDTVTGCQFYNPSPPGSNAPVTYFILDDEFLNQFIDWTFDGTDLLDWRNTVLPTLPNFLFDASVAESGDSLYVSFFGVNHPDIVVVDSLSNPVTLNWQTVTTTVPCLTTTFTVVDPTDTIIQYLMIGNYVLPSSSLPVTDPQCAVKIQNIFVGNSFGTTTTVNISVVGNDVTLTVQGSNGLITGIRWVDSLLNTGDETFTTC